MSVLDAPALDLLQAAFGAEARFKAGQLEAIEAATRPGARLLVVQQTGWGKSIVYFIATALNRQSGRGLTLLVSPLLALMRNQVDMAQRLGVRARTLDSTNADAWSEIVDEVLAGEVDALMVSPERLANAKFNAFLEALRPKIGLLVVDEAHCISDWGHDFRPDYRRIRSLIDGLEPECAVLATTATATKRVERDVAEQLGGGFEYLRGPLLRASLRIAVFEMDDPAERLAWFEKFIPRFPGSGIVYAMTVPDCEQVAAFLRSREIEAIAYHGQLEHEARLDIESRFSNNELKVVVATSALGMGYDKADVGFVAHYQAPASLLAYYQQIGRAGRMMDSAFASLLFGESDRDIAKRFAMTAAPPTQFMNQVLEAVGSSPESVESVAKRLKKPRVAVEHALRILASDGLLETVESGYARADAETSYDHSRQAELLKMRLQESDEVFAFARSTGCRMQFLARALGDAESEPCGRCDNCHPHALVQIDPERVGAARSFLQSERFVIAVRKLLPMNDPLTGSKSIPPELRPQEGLAMSAYGDAGYGRLVRDLKYRGADDLNELCDAAAQAIRDWGAPAEWLTWTPSTTNGQLERLARGIADRLGIPAQPTLTRRPSGVPQKALRSSKAQCLNVWREFAAASPMAGNCLLIDDMVDSGWTFAAASFALLSAGSGPVYPFALATAKPRRFL